MSNVFHGSPNAGLTVIEPRLSTHHKAWVYASKDENVAILFMAPWSDFDLNLAYEEDGQLTLTERYPNALKKIFHSRQGWLYTLDGTLFEKDATRFEGEMVSREPAKVICSRFIPDTFKEISSRICKGLIRLRRYPDRHPDIPADDADLLEEVLFFCNEGNSEMIKVCLAKHPHLAARLQNALNLRQTNNK
ncbi:MAG: hypothetical protein VB108_02855 [Anaerolineaceae bacterium]|nr:hypothetical protein [Anaerolineaceae bacterium]